jgi:hypothetical protein
VVRLCRRIALRRECGDTVAAEEIRCGPLAAALEIVRAKTGATAAEVERRLEVIFAAEQERVANAAVLAELLAPLLRDRLPAATADGAVPGSASPRLPPPPPPKRFAAANIADFIDEMLAYERATASAESSRRAS